jgi:hypothetical protein
VRSALHQNTQAVVMMTKQTSQASVRLVTTGITAGTMCFCGYIARRMCFCCYLVVLSWQRLFTTPCFDFVVLAAQAVLELVAITVCFVRLI